MAIVSLAGHLGRFLSERVKYYIVYVHCDNVFVCELFLFFYTVDNQNKVSMLHETYLKSVECPVCFDREDMVIDGEEVTMRGHQVTQVQCFGCERNKRKIYSNNLEQ